MSQHIYLDNNATTRMDPRVLEVMLPYFCEKFGNAASMSHEYGWVAEEAVKRGRQQVADLLGAGAKDIIFTSGATESDNLAIKGTVEMLASKGKHVITCTTEHKAILDPCKYLESKGLAEIGELCHAKKVLFHTDGVQAFGKVPIDVKAMNIDLMSVSAHKIYGPKGVGALYVRRRKPRVRLSPQIHGGGHERGNRSGTLNVPSIVGFGEAARLAREGMAEEAVRTARLRNRLRDRLHDEVQHVTINGSSEHVLPGTINMSFEYIEGESLLMALKDVALSSGSACTSASLEPSYVLRAMGLDDELAHSSLRMTVGRFTTEEEIDYVVELIKKHVTRLRDMSPLWEMVQEGIDLKSIQWTAH